MGQMLERLNDRQKIFVEIYVELGGRHGAGKRAAIAAGYSEEHADTYSSHLLRQPKILDALKEIAETRMYAGVVMGAETMLELCESGNESTRFKAAKVLMENGGVLERLAQHNTMNLTINSNDQRTENEILAAIRDKLVAAGMVPAEVIDAHFEEVAAPEESKGETPTKKRTKYNWGPPEAIEYLPAKSKPGPKSTKRRLIPGKIIESQPDVDWSDPDIWEKMTIAPRETDDEV